MPQPSSLTAEFVRSILDYDPETGIATWRPKPPRTRLDRTFNTRFAGKAAGSRHKTYGYLCVGINRRVYYLQQIIWLHYYGEWPALLVDHSDGDRVNNRITNLRLATYSQNGRNRGMQANNTSGYKGVCFDAYGLRIKRWMASIYDGKYHIYLGRFATREEAAAAYREAALRLHGEFSRTG